jgi:Fe-S-cluster containining protein
MIQDRRWDLFKCQRCGKCCVEIGLPYDPESIFEIAKFLDLKVDQVIEKYYGRISDDGKAWESEDYKRAPCPFLSADGDIKSCSIYSVRPLGCRLYPFDTDFGRAGIDCPGARIVYEKLEEEEEA